MAILLCAFNDTKSGFILSSFSSLSCALNLTLKFQNGLSFFELLISMFSFDFTVVVETLPKLKKTAFKNYFLIF